MDTFMRTWRLMDDALGVLKKDPELLVFPFLSSIAAALVAASFALPLLDEGARHLLTRLGENDPLVYLWAFLFYVANSFVVIFFNAAIVACALARMTGRDPTVRFGLRAAWHRRRPIFLWALATGTVGFLLRMIEERVGGVGRIVVALLGMTWSVTSFLVVPVLVHKGTGPVDAYQDSVAMLTRSWGEQIIGTVSFAWLFVVLGLVPAGVLFGVATTGSLIATGTAAVLCVLYLVVLGLAQSTLQAIYQAAVYCYARTGSAPDGFDERALAHSFRPR